MKARISKISIFFLVFAVAVLQGCETSLNTELEADNGDSEFSQMAAATATVPTVVNDGLEKVNISGIGATNFITAGTGTFSETQEQIEITVPEGAKIERVYLYWARRTNEEDHGTDNTIEVNGTDYTGNIVGSINKPDDFDERAGITYRVDLTDEIDKLGLVPGGPPAIINVEDDVFESSQSLGASLIVFYSLAGEQSELILYDGADFIYLPYQFLSKFESLDDDVQTALATAVPVTFTFAPANVDRSAKLTLFIGDVELEDANERPNSLRITIGGSTIIYGAKTSTPFPFQAFQGAEWDNYVKYITIPAGVQQVTVEPISGPRVDNVNLPASLIWSFAGLSIQSPQGGEGCTPGYWKQEHHYGSWPNGYSPTDGLEDHFDVPRRLELAKPEREDPESLTLIAGLELRGGKVNSLIRHAVAALLNAASDGVSYDLTVSEVQDKFNDAVDDKGNRKREIRVTKNLFEDFNEQGCPLN